MLRGSNQLYAGQSTKHFTHTQDVPGPWEIFPRSGRRDPRTPLTVTVAARPFRLSGGLEAVFYAEGENIYHGTSLQSLYFVRVLISISFASH
jgi:hypothetical protein